MYSFFFENVSEKFVLNGLSEDYKLAKAFHSPNLPFDFVVDNYLFPLNVSIYL